MNGKNICMLGVCGAGMAPLAIYSAQRGYNVYGWDDHANTEIKEMLIANEVVFMPEKILPPNCDIVVRSSAVNSQKDSVCQMAQQKNITVVRRGEFLAKICSDRKLVAVVGSHGKTSVTASCIEMLKENGILFDYILGGFFKKNAIPPAEYNPAAEYVVAEIDESDGTIANFSPEFTIALNYDDDHVCNYCDRNNFIKTFENLFERTKQKIFVPEADGVFTNLAFGSADKYVKIPKSDAQDFTVINQEVALFSLEHIWKRKMSSPAQSIGVNRRNEIMFAADNFVVLNDYAHHPFELEFLLKYAQSQYPDYELNIVFQPHRLSRTKQYFAEFAAVLSKFDRPYVVELYSAFEDNIDGVSSLLVLDRITNRNKRYLDLANFNTKMHEIFRQITNSEKKQLILFVGAGNILSHAKRFVNEIAFASTASQLAENKIRFSRLKDLTDLFSIKINTVAAIHAEPSTPDELRSTIRICKRHNVKYVIIGNGTKTLPPDGIINAVVITLKSGQWATSEWADDNYLFCFCGVKLRNFCELVRMRQFRGVEKLQFIPCCMGGAIYMNAGAHGQTISDCLASIVTMGPDGDIQQIEKNDLEFGYRSTSIPKNHVIIGATFRFQERATEEYFESSSSKLLKWRQANQPKGLNFGSVFKNGDDFCAGKLLDAAGLKGCQVGGASISTEHANFIINHGNASAIEVEKLIDLMRYEVFNKFKKYLKTEINFLKN